MTTRTTTHLKIKRLDRPEIITAVCLVIFLTAVTTAAIRRHTPAPVVDAAPTPALPVILIATQVPTPAAVVSAAAPNTFTRATVVYASPGGDVLGAVEAGRHFGFMARSGDGWVELDIDGTGAAWVKSGDLMGAPALSDLATPTSQPQPIIVREAVPVTFDNVKGYAAPTPAQCYHSERQAMVQGVSVGVGVGDSCTSQQEADQQAARAAFAQMNDVLMGAPGGGYQAQGSGDGVIQDTTDWTQAPGD